MNWKENQMIWISLHFGTLTRSLLAVSVVWNSVFYKWLDFKESKYFFEKDNRSQPRYLPSPCDLKSSVVGADIYKLGDTRKRYEANQLKLYTDVG